jgi:hypothetical protein
MNRARTARWSTCLFASAITGCAAPLDAPSAYIDEQFLCGEEHTAEFDALVANCRNGNLAGGKCAGVGSVAIDLPTQQAIIDSEFDIATYEPDPRDPVMRSMSIRGVSPYFVFRLSLGVTTPSLSAGGTTAKSDEHCVRPAVGSATVGLEVRGSSDTLAFRLSSCTINARDGLRVTYSGDLVRGGTMKACVYIVPGADLVP